MKRNTLWWLVSGLVTACGPTVEPDTAFAAAGTYQLIAYQSSTKTDETPTGETTLTQVNNQHVNIVVKGTSGNTKINYSFANTEVVSSGFNHYLLLYKSRVIGEAGNDGLSRYVTITPASGVVIKAMEF